MNNEEIKILETLAVTAREIRCAEADVKPCFAHLWKNGIEKGNRDSVSYILACEMRRMGIEQEVAIRHLIKWNNRISKPLPSATIITKIRSAYKKGPEGHTNKGGYKTFGCNGLLGQFCVSDKETCIFRRNHSSGNVSSGSGRGTGISTFAMLGWWKKLNKCPFKVYCGIVLFEEIKGLNPGDRIFGSQSQIAKLSGVTKPSVDSSLKTLFFEGLILKYKKGERHFWKHKAGEIQRVIPIPRINQRKPYIDTG